MIKKLDLRTPQVLLETQIVEARRNFLRNLGSQTGFRYVQAPEIGNGTGFVFPNSIDIGGVVSNGIASGANPISFLFGSADGSRTLTEVLTAEEQEGRVKVVSKPAVATLNNKPATIKSTVAIRIRIPQGGNVVSTGATQNLTGGALAATEKVETGIILEVTPQASPDYYVLLDIKAKSSTLGPPYVDSIPSEIERATNSSVLVSSGQTFAMGGVYKLSETGSNNGLPWFKDIPVLGTFFRSTGIDDFEEEILFFITPRIVEGSFDDDSMKASL
jgi:type IV pilus assembly protein PilQ